jgi:hypothetical protein
MRQDLVAQDADFEVLRGESVRNNICAFLRWVGKDDDVDVWSPLVELA